MTLNGNFRQFRNGPYFAFLAEFGSFRGALHKSGGQSHNYMDNYDYNV